jgi:hypothetical protein
MIRLQREVTVTTFDVEATVALGRDRPEFLAVARLAADLGGSLDGGDIARELLGGLPQQIGWRVLDRCVALDLLQRATSRGPAELSTTGRGALEKGTVLVPEEGVWRFFLVSDPLVEDPLVHVLRLETPRADEERNGAREARKQRLSLPSGSPVPERLTGSADRELVHRSVASSQAFALREIGGAGTAGPGGRLRLVLEWEGEGVVPCLRLRGDLGSATQGEMPLPVDSVLPWPFVEIFKTYDWLWRTLVADATGVPAEELKRWRESAGRHSLPLAFTDRRLDDEARQSMEIDLALPQSHVADLGLFDPTTLRETSVVPRTPADAQAWAEWLLWQSIADYSTPAMLRSLGQKVRGRHPFEDLVLPEADELLDRARAAPLDPHSRFVLAPADLGLWRQP